MKLSKMYRRTYCSSNSSQVGAGLSDFNSVPYQRGQGIGVIAKRIAVPLAKYIGKKLFKVGVGVGVDVVSRKPISEAIKRNARKGIKEVYNETLTKAANMIDQSGMGIKRRKRVYKKKKIIKRKVKKTKKIKRPRKIKRVKKRHNIF